MTRLDYTSSSSPDSKQNIDNLSIKDLDDFRSRDAVDITPSLLLSTALCIQKKDKKGSICCHSGLIKAYMHYSKPTSTPYSWCVCR